MNGHRPPSFRGGFTLVELLLVLGMIAVLVAVLVPVIGAARQHSQATACMSNLRQWAQGVQAYAAQNNGYLPRRGQGKQPTVKIDRGADWFNAVPAILDMKPYLQLAAEGSIPRPGNQSSIWLCPNAVGLPGTNYFSYGMNMGLSVWDGDENSGRPDNIAAVGNPSAMVLMADAPGDRCSVFPSKTLGGYNPVPRHGGRVNISFLDGHVSAIDASYVGVGSGLVERADMRWHPPNSKWNGAQ